MATPSTQTMSLGISLTQPLCERTLPTQARAEGCGCFPCALKSCTSGHLPVRAEPPHPSQRIGCLSLPPLSLLPAAASRIFQKHMLDVSPFLGPSHSLWAPASSPAALLPPTAPPSPESLSPQSLCLKARPPKSLYGHSFHPCNFS